MATTGKETFRLGASFRLGCSFVENAGWDPADFIFALRLLPSLRLTTREVLNPQCREKPLATRVSYTAAKDSKSPVSQLEWIDALPSGITVFCAPKRVRNVDSW